MGIGCDEDGVAHVAIEVHGDANEIIAPSIISGLHIGTKVFDIH